MAMKQTALMRVVANICFSCTGICFSCAGICFSCTCICFSCAGIYVLVV